MVRSKYPSSLNWLEVNTGLTDISVKSLVANGMNLFAGTSNGSVFLSTDEGRTWNDKKIGLTNNSVNSIFVNDSILLASTSGGIYLSTNNGNSWSGENDGLITMDVRAINFYGTNLLAGTSTGLFISSTTEYNWQPNGFSGSLIFAIETCDSILAIGTNGGVYLTMGDYKNWKSCGLDNVFAVKIIGNYLYAGTYDYGVCFRPISDLFVGVKDISKQYPAGFVLKQNYPNPFNPSTKISFEIPYSGNVTIKIFDLLGREIKVLLDEYKQRGTYTIDFDASEISSGVYFYRLKSNNFSSTKKMILLR